MTKTPVSKASKQQISNPFDSDSESKQKPNSKNSRTSSSPLTSKSNAIITPSGYHEDEERGASSASYLVPLASKNHYKNDFRDSGGLENQSVQELEGYAVYKAEGTTKAVNGCLKIAEEIREDATTTLIALHQQGQQITRTHMTAANIDHDLSMGEKLLGSLGGMFSKTWKPKKTRTISGPLISRDDSYKTRGNHLEQREKLGLVGSSNSKGQSNPRRYNSEPATALEKVEVEKAKQDDAFSDLSSVLGQLKDMALDMGSEIERQNKALDHFDDDVEELNYRVKGANQRGRRLLGK